MWPLTGITIDPRKGAVSVTLPCGQCIGCRLDRSQDWSTRLYHEAQLHEESSFLTLTFRDEDLPWDRSVSVRDVQLFMKRLRKAVGRVRFFACGEYGEANQRPHYHILIFGYDFPDKVPWRLSPSGYPLYRSPMLEKLWPFGHCEIGEVTKQSAGYVARYCIKKVTGERARDHYTSVNPDTGEVAYLTPEFLVMSTKPGIGAGWYEKYSSDAFPSDFVTIDGSKVPVPRYYTKKLAEKELNQVKLKRLQRSIKHKSNNTPDRLAVREEIQVRRADLLKRDFET